MSTIYTGMSGMIANEVSLYNTGNNISNSTTTAYKTDSVTHKVFEEAILRRLDQNGRTILGNFNHQVIADQKHTDFRPGFPEVTFRSLDIFIEDATENTTSFLAVQRGNETYYSRDGNLKVDAEGNLMNNEGFYILNIDGERISLPNLRPDHLTIDRFGRIIDKGSGNVIDQLLVMSFDTEQLTGFEKVGSNAFTFNGESQQNVDIIIHQGYLESSNFDMNKEMVNLITAQKGYSLNAKSFQISDIIRDIESNELGR